jgi:NADH-quinone oxidoreductase subunit D
VAAHEAGFDTLFMYTWRDRETVMDIVEELSGNRVNYSANLLGGVKFDVTPAQIGMIRQGLDFLEDRIRHYLEIVTKDIAFIRRTRGIGVMTRKEAEEMGALGPTARASRVGRDVRVQAPYSAYHDFPVNIILETAGDLEARFVVRLKELLETGLHIRHLLDNLPEGELTARMPRRIHPGEVISRVEAPRGELFYFIKSNGSDQPERIKIRTPTLCNMATVMNLAVGHQLADIPMLLVGVDPCFSCNDRAVLLKSAHDGRRIWTWEQLRQYGIEHYQ